MRRISYLGNAASPHTVRWVNHFRSKGYEVDVFSFELPQDICEGVRVYQLRKALPFGLSYFSGFRRVRQLVARIRPSLVHAHYASGYGTLGRLLGFHPYVVSAWGSDIFEFPKRSPIHRWMLTKNLAAADYVCSTSRAMANEISKYTSKPVLITPFGVDCEVFSPVQSSHEQTNRFVIGTVRSLEKSYGIDCLLKAFKLLMVRHPDWPCELVIVGGGNLESAYRELALSLNLGKRIRFVGKVSHCRVADYVRSFSVFAALSNSESFGVAVLEASSCGIPVVVSNVGGLLEVVVDGKTGLVVSPNDEVAAAGCFEKLFLSSSLRDSLGQGGRRWVRERYEWNQTARIMENLYEEVIATKKPERGVTSSESSSAAAV